MYYVKPNVLETRMHCSWRCTRPQASPRVAGSQRIACGAKFLTLTLPFHSSPAIHKKECLLTERQLPSQWSTFRRTPQTEQTRFHSTPTSLTFTLAQRNTSEDGSMRNKHRAIGQPAAMQKSAVCESPMSLLASLMLSILVVSVRFPTSSNRWNDSITLMRLWSACSFGVALSLLFAKGPFCLFDRAAGRCTNSAPDSDASDSPQRQTRGRAIPAASCRLNRLN